MADIKQIKVGEATYDLRDSRIITLTDSGSTTAGTWIASAGSSTQGTTLYTDGQLFLYKVAVAGATPTTLNINGLGAKTVYRSNTTKLTTHYVVGSYILLYYSSSLNSGSFIVVNDYATDNDKKTASNNTSNKIFLIGATSQSPSGQTTYSHDTAYVGTDGCLYSDSKKVLTEHPAIETVADTTSTASPAHGSTFTTVDSITRDSNGHVTKVNTKTVTLPNITHSHTGVDIKGSYFVIDTLDQRNSVAPGNLMTGTLCYCQETEKFYQYSGDNNTNNSNEWVELKVGGISGSLNNGVLTLDI